MSQFRKAERLYEREKASEYSDGMVAGLTSAIVVVRNHPSFPRFWQKPFPPNRVQKSYWISAAAPGLSVSTAFLRRRPAPSPSLTFCMNGLTSLVPMSVLKLRKAPSLHHKSMSWMQCPSIESLPEVVAQHDMVVFNLPQFPEDFVSPK